MQYKRWKARIIYFQWAVEHSLGHKSPALYHHMFSCLMYGPLVARKFNYKCSPHYSCPLHRGQLFECDTPGRILAEEWEEIWLMLEFILFSAFIPHCSAEIIKSTLNLRTRCNHKSRTLIGMEAWFRETVIVHSWLGEKQQWNMMFIEAILWSVGNGVWLGV